MSHQLSGGIDCSSVEVGTMPSPATLPEQVADNPVVGTDVEIGLAGRLTQQRFNLTKLWPASGPIA